MSFDEAMRRSMLVKPEDKKPVSKPARKKR
jgi:hypothetical protein